MSADRVAPRTERAFVTPEGVDLRLNIGDAGQRAGAFLLDAAIIIAVAFALNCETAAEIMESVISVKSCRVLSAPKYLSHSCRCKWIAFDRDPERIKRLDIC